MRKLNTTRTARKRLGTITKALLIQAPFIDWILSGKKTWEIRGYPTTVRGPIALIRSGSGTIVGTCNILKTHGPLTRRELVANCRRLGCRANEIERSLPYPKTYAWVIHGAKSLRKPLRYKHPNGAIGWVRLDRTRVG